MRIISATSAIAPADEFKLIGGVAVTGIGVGVYKLLAGRGVTDGSSGVGVIVGVSDGIAVG